MPYGDSGCVGCDLVDRRRRVGVGVDGHRRGEHEPLDARRIDRPQQPRRAHHVGVEILVEAIEAAADRDLRREMEDAVDAGQRVGDGALVADVAVHEARALRHRLAAADRQIVEDRDLPAARRAARA